MMDTKTTRNSSLELLRLICIFGIIIMHTIGPFFNEVTQSDLVFGVFANSIFNAGVSIFMLISGYYGVKTDIRKILRIWMQAWIYSMAVLIIKSVFRHVALTEIFRAFLPISSNSHWYITVYIIILLLAKYLNKIIENLSRKQYEQLLLVLLLIFSIVPTITFSNITNDSGKGVINMTIMYMIGQYLSKYSEPNKTKRNVALAVFAFSVQFALNMLLSYLKGGKGIAAHFSLDYSVFTVLLAVGIFNLFINKHYTSKAVNALSSHVMGIYLAEGVVRSFLQRFIDLGTLLNSALFPLGVVGFTLLVIAMSIVIDVVYRWFYKLFGEKIIGLMVKCTELISDKCKNVISKKQSQ